MKLFANLKYVALLIIFCLGIGSKGYSQNPNIIELQGSSIPSPAGGHLMGYRSLSDAGNANPSTQTVVMTDMIVRVSLDYGDVANLQNSQGAMNLSFSINGLWSTLTGSLECTADKLEDAIMFKIPAASLPLPTSDNGINVVVSGVSNCTNGRFMVEILPEYSYNTDVTNVAKSQIQDPEDANKIKLSWYYWNGAYLGFYENYEIQILKLEPKISLTLVNFDFDWSNALKLQVSGNSYSFMPSEGAGCYTWRIRPIGSAFVGGAANASNLPDWPTDPTGSNIAIGSYYEHLTVAPFLAHWKFKANPINVLNTSPFATVFFVPEKSNSSNTGLYSDKNWTYMQQFAEDGKRKEVVTYANGLNQVRQTQTKLNTLGDVVANATVYDFSGRGALNTMMAPTGNDYFDYDATFFVAGSGTTQYSAANFDTDGNRWNPEVAGSQSSLNNYYGSSNSGTMQDLYVPDGESRTYTRNVFTPDATGRNWVQGGVGSDLRLGNPNDVQNFHNTVVEYASVEQDELDYLFGNEAPLAENVYKTSTRDPNGVTSINYMTKKGEVLATMLDGAKVTDYTDRLDLAGSAVTIPISGQLDDGILQADGMSTETTKTIMLMGTVDDASLGRVDPVVLTYQLDPAVFNIDCDGTVVCEDCDYRIEIEITDSKSNITDSDYDDRNARLIINVKPDVVDNDCTTNSNYGNIFSSGAGGVVSLSVLNLSDGLANTSGYIGTMATGTVKLKPGVYTIKKRVFINNYEVPNTSTGESYLEFYLSQLEASYEDWTLTDNCCGPMTAPVNSWSCDTIVDVGCNSGNLSTEVSEIAAELWSYINMEVSHNYIYASNPSISYLSTLSISQNDLLSTQIGYTSASQYESTIQGWICDKNIPSTRIRSCINLFGQHLISNINVGEGFGAGTIQGTANGSGAFKDEYDFLLSVFNCLSVSASGTTCSDYSDIVAYGINGPSQTVMDAINIANQSGKGLIVTYNVIDNPGGVNPLPGINPSLVRIVEIVHPGFSDMNSPYVNHNTQNDLMVALAQDNCLKYLKWPNSTINTGSEKSDREALASAACNCLSAIPDPMPDMQDEFAGTDGLFKNKLTCESICDDNAVMYGLAFDNEVNIQNQKLVPSSDPDGIILPGWDANPPTTTPPTLPDPYTWDPDICGDKECQVALLVDDCKSRCDLPFHTYLDDQLKIDIQSQQINTFTIPTVITNDIDLLFGTPPGPGTTLGEVYTNVAAQDYLAHESQRFEDVFLGAAQYAAYHATPYYSVGDYSSVVKDEIIEFYYKSLETGMSRRHYGYTSYNLANSLVGLDPGILGIKSNYYSKEFNLKIGNEEKVVTAEVFVHFTNQNTEEDYSDDLILELVIRLNCSGGTELFSWAVGNRDLNRLAQCGIFSGISAAGYDPEFHIADFFFDQYDNFHAVPSVNMCWIADDSWYVYNNVSAVQHSAVAVVTVNTNVETYWFKIQTNDGAGNINSTSLMSGIVTVSGSATDVAQQIANKINTSSSNPVAQAINIGSQVFVYIYDDELLDITGTSACSLEVETYDNSEPDPTLKKLVSTFAFGTDGVRSFDGIDNCTDYSVPLTKCPEGYDVVIGPFSGSTYGINVNGSVGNIQVIGDAAATFFKDAFQELVDTRITTVSTLSPAVVNTNKPDCAFVYPGGNPANSICSVETYEKVKTWNIQGFGRLEAIVQVNAIILTNTITGDVSNTISSASFLFRSVCGLNTTSTLADFYILPYVKSVGDAFINPSYTIYYQNGVVQPGSYQPMMANLPANVVFNDILFDHSDNQFAFDVNVDLVNHFAGTMTNPNGNMQVLLSVFGSKYDKQFNDNGVGTVIPWVGSGVDPMNDYLAFGQPCGEASSGNSNNCEACIRYTFDVDNSPTDVEMPITCEEMQQQNQNNQIREMLSACLETKSEELVTNYKTCATNYSDNFGYQFNVLAGQFTLYHYDRAGNLISTVPPAGVRLLNATQVASVKQYRASSSGNTPVFTNHKMKTNYKYNSLKQLIWQSTPDGGESNFGYNDLGQLILSQNAEQALHNKYSYSQYDYLGRIIEVGEFKYPGTTSNFNTVTQQVIDDSDLSGSSFNPKTENVLTTYGITRNSSMASGTASFNLENVRNRVEKTTNAEVTTYYSYDMHGNVKRLIHDINEIGVKIIDYEYDLVSGNVNQVSYNPHYHAGHIDQFHHRYTYDLDNRIKEVYTSKDSVIWTRDAAYEYYLHGPLARVEIGQDEIQGVDYVYTLQGFLKSINNVELNKDGKNDVGADGAPTLAIFDIDIPASANITSVSIVVNGSSPQNLAFPSGVNSDKEFSKAFVQAVNKFFTLNGADEESLKAEFITDDEVKLYATNMTSPPSFTMTLNNAGSGSPTVKFNDFIVNSTAIDAWASELGYFANDYIRDGTDVGKTSDVYPFRSSNLGLTDAVNSLYNGNISTWQSNSWTGIHKNDIIDAEKIKLNVYRYDAINRLKNSSFTFWDGNDYQSDNERFLENFGYDGNGNIDKAIRFGVDGTEPIDVLDYQYANSNNNRLDYIEDGAGIYPSDNKDFHIGTQADGNYTYDANGNLTRDVYMEQVITWNVMGKVKSVTGNGNITNMAYDAQGNRLTKEVLKDDGTLLDKYYYVRDASGNVMAMYKKHKDGNSINLSVEEYNLFGSERIGVEKTFKQDIFNDPDYSSDKNPQLTSSVTQTNFGVVTVYPLLANRTVGLKAYELKDHLGNVRVVVSDRKEFDGNLKKYTPQIISLADYYAFGSQMPKRNASSNEYRYGFNGMEKDDEVKGNGNSYDFGARIYDPRIARWLSLDPLAAQYPFASPYNFVLNTPIQAIDPDGKKVIPAGKEEVKHLNSFIGATFGKNSGFKVTKNGIKVNRKKLAKAGFKGDLLELAKRMDEVATNDSYTAVFTLGSSASVSNQVGTTMKEVANYIEVMDKRTQKMVTILDPLNPTKWAEVPIQETNTVEGVGAGITVMFYNKGKQLENGVVIVNPDYFGATTDANGDPIAYDEEGNPIALEAYATTAHELLGHLFDLFTESKDDTAIKTENKARKIFGFKARSGKNHTHKHKKKIKY